MSKGIRIYEHSPNRKRIGRDSYNIWAGMDAIDEIRLDPSLEVIAIGCEEGAMVLHYRWKY